MTLRLSNALVRGARRAFSVSGLTALALTICHQVVFVGSLNTVIANGLPPSAHAGGVGGVGFAFPLPTGVAVALGATALVFGVWVSLVAARLLTREFSALSSLGSGLFTRRTVPAVLSALAVSVVLAVVIPLGFALLFVPGLFLTVSLQFALFAVAIEDTGPVDALRRSWDLASGNRWRLLVLVVLFGVVGGIGGAFGSMLAFASPSIGQVASLLINSVLIILMYGILADSFIQLRGEPASPMSLA